MEEDSKAEFKKDGAEVQLPPDPQSAGYHAYKLGKGINCCPYLDIREGASASDVDLWIDGWHTAREEEVRSNGGGDLEGWVAMFYRTTTDPRHTLDSPDEARNLGYESAEEGGSNPYAYGSKRWRQFDKGWKEKLSDLGQEEEDEFDLSNADRVPVQGHTRRLPSGELTDVKDHTRSKPSE